MALEGCIRDVEAGQTDRILSRLEENTVESRVYPAKSDDPLEEIERLIGGAARRYVGRVEFDLGISDVEAIINAANEAAHTPLSLFSENAAVEQKAGTFKFDNADGRWSAPHFDRTVGIADKA